MLAFNPAEWKRRYLIDITTDANIYRCKIDSSRSKRKN